MSDILRTYWTCNKCGCDNPSGSKKCNRCAIVLYGTFSNKYTERWQCPDTRCKALNIDVNCKCQGCHKKKKELIQLVKDDRKELAIQEKRMKDLMKSESSGCVLIISISILLYSCL